MPCVPPVVALLLTIMLLCFVLGCETTRISPGTLESNEQRTQDVNQGRTLEETEIRISPPKKEVPITIPQPIAGEKTA